MIGCMNVSSSVDGRRTSLGQELIQSWQDVQCCARCFMLKDPGGVILVTFSLAFLSLMIASPPSTFFSCALMIVLTAIMADEERKTLFPLSIISGFPSSFFVFLPEPILSLYFIAFLLHFPMQSIQTTQRE